MKRGQKPGIMLTTEEKDRLIGIMTARDITVGALSNEIGLDNYFLLYNPLFRDKGCSPSNYGKIITYLRLF